MINKSFRQLIVWQKAIFLVKEIYATTEQFPKSELFTLTSQLRRSAISIPSNIAEGYKRNNRKEYVHFLGIANASSAELETQILISKEIYKQIDVSKCESLVTEVQKMLYILIKRLKE